VDLKFPLALKLAHAPLQNVSLYVIYKKYIQETN